MDLAVTINRLGKFLLNFDLRASTHPRRSVLSCSIEKANTGHSLIRVNLRYHRAPDDGCDPGATWEMSWLDGFGGYFALGRCPKETVE